VMEITSAMKMAKKRIGAEKSKFMSIILLTRLIDRGNLKKSLLK